VHPNSFELLRDGIIEPGYEKLVEKREKRDGTFTYQEYLVKKKPEQGMTGKYLTRAYVTRNPLTNKPEIDFELDREGTEIFGNITRQFSPQAGRKYQLAIVLDGVLYSAPEINGPIEGGRGQITGSFSDREAFELSNVLENPLDEAPVRIAEERSVDPSLGKDSIRHGLIAATIAAISTALFMILFYFFGGLIANLALLLNVLILTGVMCSIQATLTLPGIAGIALTMGWPSMPTSSSSNAFAKNSARENP
jgi:protein-export membrane protein SecD